MNVVSGSVQFGGKISYCQQNGKWHPATPTRVLTWRSAWIQNATLRENVLFGQAWDEHRYWTAIKDASLIPDLEILPDGDLTEVSATSVTRKD